MTQVQRLARIAALEAKMNYVFDHRTPLRFKVAAANELRALRAA